VCEILKISRSTVYYRRKTPTVDPLEQPILDIYKQHMGNYGAPRIKAVLATQGHTASRRRIGKVLRTHGLECKHGRRKLARNVHTSDKDRYIADNLIKGETVTASNQICQMDASEFKHSTGSLCVSGIIDLYDRTVVIAYGNRENKELIAAIIQKRIALGKPWILHSDRGSGNISLKVKELLDNNGIKRSMTAPRSPHENQFIESFWKSAKTEIGDTRGLTREQLMLVLDYYIYYYNEERIHSSIGYLTPAKKRFQSLGSPSD